MLSWITIAVKITTIIWVRNIIAIIALAGGLDKTILGVSVFFGLIAIATGLLIYNGIYYSKESDDSKEKKENLIEKQVTNIIDIIGVIIYLVISFMTMAWHLTWIIFLIVGLVNAIVKLIFMISSNKTERNDNKR